MQSSQQYEQLLSAIRRIVRSVDLRSRQLVRSHGLTGPQMLLIKELLAMGETTVSRLADRVNLSQATVTDILNRLENRGLITRTRSDQDRRCVFIKLTEAARESLQGTPQLFADSFAMKFEALQEWEQFQLVSSLNRVASMMSGDAGGRFSLDAGERLLPDSKFKQPVKPVKRRARGNQSKI